ncbi:MAG: tyrosine-type recombinase/integrase, partial [Acidobacteria bacterium]|nr:tyrosine-type recombinase/integrase [Acidobacteriota bacterium]
MKVRKHYRYDLDLVFANDLGLPLRRYDVWKNCFKPVVEAAGIEGRATLYTLRHTYATLLLAAHEQPKTVSENMGHANVAFTLDTYAHVLPSQRDHAAVKLEKILKS